MQDSLQPNDQLLINWVENFLKLLQGTGGLANLEQRWFKDGSWVEELP